MKFGGTIARRYVFGRSRAQPLFKFLHRIALVGLNFGPADPASSGERWVLSLLANTTTATPVIFDVGANIGAYAREVLRLLPDARLYCFEPSPSAFEQLKHVVHGRASLRPFGLGSRNESRALFTDRPGSGMASVYRRDLRHVGVTDTLVETALLRRLDDVCVDEDIETIDLLKLDVEGNELEVLRGAEKMLESGGVRAIQFEFGGANIDSRTYLHDFVMLLGDGYQIHRILKDGLVLLDPLLEINEVFVTANYLCLRRTA